MEVEQKNSKRTAKSEVNTHTKKRKQCQDMIDQIRYSN